jgi:polyhydroxyalkanoate synthase
MTTGLMDTMTRWVADRQKDWQRWDAAVQYAVQPVDPQVGRTPKRTIWRKNKAKLYRYQRQTPARHAVPILLVYALINKPYILDLMPGNSLVEHLLAEGFDVYLLDWGTPGEEDAGMTLADYVLDYMPKAVAAMKRECGAESYSMLGYCMGGTFATLYTALRQDPNQRNLILLTTPIDFSNAGLYSTWLDPKHFDVDRLVDTYGIVPAHLIGFGGKLLKPLPNQIGPYVGLWDRLDDPAFVASWQAIDHWVNDGIPFAGEAYRQWIKDLYQGNKLVKGTLQIDGRPVDLGAIHCNVLNVIADQDHIVPPCQSEALSEKVASLDVETLRVPAGHVGVVMGRSAKQRFFPQLAAWLGERSS